jgi:hypothetical protein
MDEGDRYTHHSVEEGDWYTHHSVDVGHVEADAGEEVADSVHHEYRVPTSGHHPQVLTRTTIGEVGQQRVGDIRMSDRKGGK